MAGQRNAPVRCLRQTHVVRRSLVYSAAALVVGLSVMLAGAWPDSRLASITIAVAFGGGLIWTARRFPAAQRIHLGGAAIVTACAEIGLAILLPTTRVLCDCPPPPGALEMTCNCPLDHHMYLRMTIAVAGLVVGA